MIEIALALVILAIGLSSVLVLFPIGVNAGKNSIADNNLGDIAERMMSYLQAEYSSPNLWHDDGSTTGNALEAFEFDFRDAEGNEADEPKDMPDVDDFSEIPGQDGLYKSGNNYYLYRQFTTDTDGNEIVDFEAMIRVGLDQKNNSTPSLVDQYYPVFATSADDSANWKKIDTYPISNTTVPENTRMNGSSAADLLQKFYTSIIMEISWPVDAPWKNREKRIFRLEFFNENFIPYPQTAPSTP